MESPGTWINGITRFMKNKKAAPIAIGTALNKILFNH